MPGVFFAEVISGCFSDILPSELAPVSPFTLFTITEVPLSSEVPLPPDNGSAVPVLPELSTDFPSSDILAFSAFFTSEGGFSAFPTHSAPSVCPTFFLSEVFPASASFFFSTGFSVRCVSPSCQLRFTLPASETAISPPAVSSFISSKTFISILITRAMCIRCIVAFPSLCLIFILITVIQRKEKHPCSCFQLFIKAGIQP